MQHANCSCVLGRLRKVDTEAFFPGLMISVGLGSDRYFRVNLCDCGKVRTRRLSKSDPVPGEVKNEAYVVSAVLQRSASLENYLSSRAL